MASNSDRKPRIFVSYKRDVHPDETVALAVHGALAQQFDVFIDQDMGVGVKWGERIDEQIRLSDFLVVFLSAESVNSEMVVSEVETAHHHAPQNGGRPVVLPVRLAYQEAFQYPLSAYLNPINWAYWGSDVDTSGLIDELTSAISGGHLTSGEQPKEHPVPGGVCAEDVPRPLPAAQPANLEMPEGTIGRESAFYVERPGVDNVALKAAEKQGITITIKGPRQVGKSSVLLRVRDAARKQGKMVAFLDFQLIEQSTLSDQKLFYQQFASWITAEVDVEDETEKYWKPPLGQSLLCTRYMSKYLLKELGRPLVLAMDEVDRLFESEFSSDFFGMLRTWHNDRASEGSIWKQLDLALVTSTEPYQLIENLNQSPFNVGEVIEPTDFTLAQVSDLNERHGRPLTPAETQQLMEFLSGHPYLVRRALYLVSSERITTAELFRTAADGRGPFGDHLRHHLFRLRERDDLVQGLRKIIRSNSCDDELIFFRLRGAGLVKKQDDGKVLPRSPLYAEFLGKNLS